MDEKDMRTMDVTIAVARRLEGWAEVLTAVGQYEECDVRRVAGLMAEGLEGDAARLRDLAASLQEG